MNAFISHENLSWQSDWDGHEVGYDDVLVVGLYKLKEIEVYFYINTETGEILEYWHGYEGVDE